MFSSALKVINIFQGTSIMRGCKASKKMKARKARKKLRHVKQVKKEGTYGAKARRHAST